jgi:hypothetical protein
VRLTRTEDQEHRTRLSRLEQLGIPNNMAKYLGPALPASSGLRWVRALSERGEQVRGIGNFATGKRENLTEVLHRDRCTQNGVAYDGHCKT